MKISDDKKLQLIQWMMGIIIFGLFISGVTAFPLQTEVEWMMTFFDPDSLLGTWLHQVGAALADVNARHPQLAYGTDWLAFAHIVLAILFIGPFRDPIRNKWVIQFGLIACAGVIPLALIAGHFRDIPFFWRLIDCSFGVFGCIPLFLALKWIQQLENTD